ncbi:MAG: MFS transporter [Nitratireductor sp.]
MQTARSSSSIPWSIVICGCLIAMLTFGPRSAMGLFQLPILEVRGWDRTTFGLAIAIQNLVWGLGQPFFGVISDKFGTWRVLLLSGIFYSSGLYLMSVATSSELFHIAGGVLVGLGIASGSFTIIMAAFARNVSADKRTIVFGLGTAAGSAGMAFFSPIAGAMIENLGWQDTLLWLSMLMLVIPLLGIALVGNSGKQELSQAELDQSVGDALREALTHRGYLLLTAGFFVCGFQVAFITAHFPAYIIDLGMAAKYGAIALSLIGLFNIFGSIASGFIGQKYSKPIFLTLIYLARSVAVTAFLLLPQTPTSVVIFSAVIGILWLSTVAPTNGLVAAMFGTRYLGLLGGIVFFSHQIGSFLGVWLGGYLYDVYGSYDVVWWLGVALGLFAAIVHWPIKERRVERKNMSANANAA